MPIIEIMPGRPGSTDLSVSNATTFPFGRNAGVPIDAPPPLASVDEKRARLIDDGGDILQQRRRRPAADAAEA